MLRNPSRVLAVAAILGILGVLSAFFLCSRERFWINWILWFVFLLTVGLGCLFVVALEHVVGAKWSVPLRRIPERLSSLILLTGPISILALFSLNALYPWSNPESLKDPVIAGKHVWLNAGFFSGRTLACLALWLAAYWIFVRGSLRQDLDRDPRFNLRARRFAPVFMIVFAITITVAAFDWISSLEPAWYSDIFGVYIFSGTFLAGLSATVLAILFLRKNGRLPQVRTDHLYNLGGFLFAFTVFWSYIGFAQYLLMWYANLPEEVFWYQERLHGVWGLILLALALFHFVVPFIVLIPREAKSSPKLLARIAGLILLSHWLDLYWMIVPSAEKDPVLGWPELSFALLFVSGGLLWIRKSMSWGEDMPSGDPLLREGLEFRL